ncbi:MAG: Smr/MutS family protein [Bacteroides sp.]|nr:Smr/MutS family protein [Ruminococcus flavefaciens]MCM1555321.1 Smr/MutS family protein [Bacteroides sp.]
MLCPKNFAQKIGFGSIVELLQGLCITSSASELAGRMHPVDDFGKLTLFLRQTAEFKQVLELEKAFPTQDYYPMGGELARLRVEGSYITLQGLQQFRASYNTLSQIKDFFAQLDAETYPELTRFGALLDIDPAILPETDRILNQTGEVRDNASENLLRIRSLIRRKSSQTQTYIGRYMSTAKQQGWVEENAEVTVRNERLVIPVGAAYKKSMRGFIHDVSATGQTVFMEPEEIFNLNNEIVELKNEERLEVIAILKAFSSFLRPKLDGLLRAYRFLTAVDFLHAKARLAILLQGELPEMRPEPCLRWHRAMHPLLYLSLQKQAQAGGSAKIVPLDISLEEGERIVIISGPNAGGKSVCLKTVGLLQYMLQCGLLVPMSEHSQAGFFRNIFVDIGDEQSIENDLSTYSSHLTNMKFWVEHADGRTLFLCDELGGGTEPNVGGAIAEALVETLLRKGAYGIVTTHYTNLKLLAKRHEGIVNGAMLFDQDALRPLYVFQKGLPGSSFAFEIARKIGLPETLLAEASRKVGRQQMHFEQELQQIEVQKHELSQKRQQIDIADSLLAETVGKYTALLADLEKNRAELMRKAKDEAKTLVKNANAAIERVIREIREAQAEKETTARLRRQLREQVAEEPQESASGAGNKAEGRIEGSSRPQKKTAAAPMPLKEGAFVRIDGEGNVAQVEKISGNTARVNFDFLHMQVPLSRLVPLNKAEAEQYVRNQPKSQVSVQGINAGGANFKPYADIRGMRADEALDAVSKLLDEALLYGHKYVEILHGKGNGVLRQLTRATAAKNPHVASYADQSEEFGGTGITVIELG